MFTYATFYSNPDTSVGRVLLHLTVCSKLDKLGCSFRRSKRKSVSYGDAMFEETSRVLCSQKSRLRVKV